MGEGLQGVRAFTLALAAGLTGCVTAPAQSVMERAAQAGLDEQVGCALWPGGGMRRDGGIVLTAQSDQRGVAPFVEAGLVTERTGERRRDERSFDLTELGSRYHTECYSYDGYPPSLAIGFRVGQRQVRSVMLQARPWRAHGLWRAVAEVRYDRLPDPDWFRPDRFATNRNDGAFDPQARTGSVDLHFVRGRGSVWMIDRHPYDAHWRR